MIGWFSDLIARWFGECREPSLPQRDPRASERRRRLERAQRDYLYYPCDAMKNPLAPIAVAVKFPFHAEIWSPGWLLSILPRVLRTLLNVWLKKAWFTLLGIFSHYTKQEAYEGFFSRLLGQPRSRLAGEAHEDEYFARERLDGPNPILIESVRSRATLDKRELILATEALNGPTLDLDDAIKEGRLFLVDFATIQRSLLPERYGLGLGDNESQWATGMGRDSRWREKYIPAPVALFYTDSKDQPKQLRPLLICIEQQSAADTRTVFLPSDGDAWTLAKLFVRVADANFHENCSHNFRHHFVMEAVAMAARRQLSRRHPIHVLLEPHIAFTIMVNRFIFRTLVKAGSAEEKMFSCTLSHVHRMMVEAREQFSYEMLDVNLDLQRRGMTNATIDYPWRDDALSWWKIIRRFVTTYVDVYYKTSKDIMHDHELQSFWSELGDPEGGNLTMPRVLREVGHLVDALTRFLFLAGPGHASVHYPLTDYLSWAPAFPRGAYAPPPAAGAVTAADIDEALPPLFRAASQFQTGQLSGHHYDSFGNYSRFRLGRLASARTAVLALQEDLGALEIAIQKRNQPGTRARPYLFLLPSQVPNGITL